MDIAACVISFSRACAACCATSLAASSSAWSRAASAGSCTLSQRISGGNVRPWTSTVPTATVNANSWISGRPGVPNGTAEAAASVTTPRIPVHDTTASACHEAESRVRPNSRSVLGR